MSLQTDIVNNYAVDGIQIAPELHCRSIARLYLASGLLRPPSDSVWYSRRRDKLTREKGVLSNISCSYSLIFHAEIAVMFPTKLNDSRDGVIASAEGHGVAMFSLRSIQQPWNAVLPHNRDEVTGYFWLPAAMAVGLGAMFLR